MRAFRGLLLRFGKKPEAKLRLRHRCLMSRSDVPLKRPRNQCHWCKRPVNPRKGSMGYWHPLCKRAWHACQGRMQMMGGRPILPKGPCVTCGNDDYLRLEIDHKLALGVAQRRGTRKDILWSYTMDNLRWLCTSCHVVKTAKDRSIMANLDNGRPEDYVPAPKVPRPVTTWRDKVPEGQQLLFK